MAFSLEVSELRKHCGMKEVACTGNNTDRAMDMFNTDSFRDVWLRPTVKLSVVSKDFGVRTRTRT